jgi:hypothetical protein
MKSQLGDRTTLVSYLSRSYIEEATIMTPFHTSIIGLILGFIGRHLRCYCRCPMARSCGGGPLTAEKKELNDK